MPRREQALSNVPPSIAIAAGLHGAFLLGRARPWGLLLFESTPSGAARSFIAMLFCLPAFLGLRLVGWSDRAVPADPARALVADLIGFVIGWVGFALVSLPLAELFGRAQHWPRFLATWNWITVLQYAVMAALVLPVSLLGLPPAIGQILGLVVLGYALWLEWYATRLALALPGFGALIFVMLDVTLALLVASFVQRLGGG